MSEQKDGSSTPSVDQLLERISTLEKLVATLAGSKTSELVELSYAELHSALFLGGKNHNLKLGDDHGKQRLVYDRTEKELHVIWNGHKGIVPLTNVASMIPRKEAAPIPIEKAIPQPTARPTAQVESPQSHVFAGLGHGKTGRGGKPG